MHMRMHIFMPVCTLYLAAALAAAASDCLQYCSPTNVDHGTHLLFSEAERLGARFPRRAVVPDSDDLHRPRAAPRPRSRVHVVKYLRTVWSAHQNDVPVHEHASTCRARSSSTVAGSLRVKGAALRFQRCYCFMHSGRFPGAKARTQIVPDPAVVRSSLSCCPLNLPKVPFARAVLHSFPPPARFQGCTVLGIAV